MSTTRVTDQTVAAETEQYLSFRLGNGIFALRTRGIKEIMGYGHVTEVPLMPAHVRGVINVRGSVLPVVDLRMKLGRGQGELTPLTCIVIAEVGTNGQRQLTGMVVDAVNAVVEIAPAEIEPPPSFGTRLRSDFMLGMSRIDGRLAIILDREKVISSEDLSAFAELADAAVVHASDAAPAAAAA